MLIKQTNDDVNAVLYLATEHTVGGGPTLFPGMTYEQGVAGAILWMIGKIENSPIDTRKVTPDL